ncbi:MAG TPA: Stf0 family sulfotransferase [Solirubrobacteraceae bacterium]
MRIQPPQHTYLVCATPRSGSTLLCKSLSATGVAGRPEEYFERLVHSGLPREPREYFAGAPDDLVAGLAPSRSGDPADARLEHVLPAAFEAGTTPNGVFGAKMMWGYFGDFLDQLGSTPEAPDACAVLERALGDMSYVHVTRRDKVAQAVSLWRAVQTQAWNAEDPAAGEPVYDERGIAHLLAGLEREDAAWTAWFAAHHLEPLVVVYEDFAADHGGKLAEVLAFLGLPQDSIPAPPLRRQADERSERWVARFSASSAGRAGAAFAGAHPAA